MGSLSTTYCIGNPFSVGDSDKGFLADHGGDRSMFGGHLRADGRALSYFRVHLGTCSSETYDPGRAPQHETRWHRADGMLAGRIACCMTARGYQRANKVAAIRRVGTEGGMISTISHSPLIKTWKVGSVCLEDVIGFVKQNCLVQ